MESQLYDSAFFGLFLSTTRLDFADTVSFLATQITPLPALVQWAKYTCPTMKVKSCCPCQMNPKYTTFFPNRTELSPILTIIVVKTQSEINALAFTGGSRYLATGGSDAIVSVWDLKKQECIRKLQVSVSFH
jgi:WD40 repeat protein